MAYLGKEYKFERHEKFDDFSLLWFNLLLFLPGTPKDRVDAILGHDSSNILVKDGDVYTLTIKYHDGVTTQTFKSGVEFDEKIGDKDVKTAIVVDGNTLVRTQKYPNGHTVTYQKEFSDNKKVVKATHDAWDGVAYRYYSA